jgi:hypothetical protein
MPFKVISVKQFTYRGVAEEWSNGYTFAGAAPADPAAWDALFDAIWANEQKFLLPDVKRVHAYGYADPNGVTTRGKAFTPAGAGNQGTMTLPGGAFQIPGDVAACVRFRVGQNSKGRPRYLTKYVHGGYLRAADQLDVSWSGFLVTGLGAMRDGTLPGGAKLCAPDGTLAGVPEPIPWLTTRTLKRRGKRPQSP